MLINEPCYVKDASVVDSTKIESNLEAAKERFLFNEALDIQGTSRIPGIKGEEKSTEGGVMLLLWSPRTGAEYKRFMPESSLRETLDERYGEKHEMLKIEDLERYANEMKNRKDPIAVTIVSNEIESEEYQKAVAASPTGEVKIKMIGQPKKKGKNK